MGDLCTQNLETFGVFDNVFYVYLVCSGQCRIVVRKGLPTKYVNQLVKQLKTAVEFCSYGTRRMDIFKWATDARLELMVMWWCHTFFPSFFGCFLGRGLRIFVHASSPLMTKSMPPNILGKKHHRTRRGNEWQPCSSRIMKRSHIQLECSAIDILQFWSENVTRPPFFVHHHHHAPYSAPHSSSLSSVASSSFHITANAWCMNV